MDMLLTLINKEVALYFRSPRFLLMFVVGVALSVISIYTGTQDYRAKRSEYENAVRIQRQALETFESYQMLSNQGIDVERPPAPLSVIADGVERTVGRTGHVSVLWTPEISAGNASVNPVLSLYGSLDLTYVVAIVLSLLAIMVSFDAICGEYEKGTLKLQLSNAVPRNKVILGKMIGGAVCLFIPIVMSLVVCVLWLTLDPALDLDNGDYLRLGGIFFAYLLYVLVFFATGLLVSAFSKRSSSALLVLLLVWIASTSVIPRAGVMVARWVSPAMTETERDSRKQEVAKDEHQIMRNNFIKARTQYRSNSDRMNIPEEQNAIREETQKNIQQAWDAFYVNVKRRHGEIESEFFRQNQRQLVLSVWLSKVSPTAMLYSSSMSFAGTGPDVQNRYRESLSVYQDQFVAYVRDKTTAEMKADIADRREPTIDLSDMPRYAFENSQSVATVFRNAIMDVAALAVLIFVLFIAAFAAFVRYDLN